MIVRSRNCDRIITRRTHQVLPNSSGRQCPLYPPKADIGTQLRDVGFVPKADIRPTHYSITSSVQGDQ